MPENPKHLQDSVSETPQKAPKIAKTAVEEFSDDEEEQHQQKVPQEPMSPNPRIQRYLVAIEYIGTRFSGSQQQPNCRTVVGILEEAFHKFIGQLVSIFCSSRTLPPHEPFAVRRAVNHFLLKNEGDIMVIDVQCVPADFHARFKAQERTYFYRLLFGPEPLSTFERDRAWHVPEELNIFAMQEACKVLVGHHDFSSFRAAGCQAKSPIRTLDEFNVCEVASSPYFPSLTERKQNNFTMEDPHTSSGKSEIDLPVGSISTDDRATEFSGKTDFGFGIRRRHRCFVVAARARSFLYHQVRLLFGVLKAVGTGDLSISDVERILNAKTLDCCKSHGPCMWSLPWTREI